MAKKARKLKTGDKVTVELSIIDVWDDMGIFTVDINGQRIRIPCARDRITKVEPYNPKAAYKDVR